MNELEVARRLVKSPPELWSACSDPDVLARHLQAFGEVRIVRLEPETTVAWEGESACGTVVLEAVGWGTKVTLTAGVDGGREPVAAEVCAEPAAEHATAAGLRGFVQRLIGRQRPPEPAADPQQPADVQWPEPPEPVPDTLSALESALDSLGQAHHRPFSRD